MAWRFLFIILTTQADIIHFRPGVAFVRFPEALVYQRTNAQCFAGTRKSPNVFSYEKINIIPLELGLNISSLQHVDSVPDANLVKTTLSTRLMSRYINNTLFNKTVVVLQQLMGEVEHGDYFVKHPFDSGYWVNRVLVTPNDESLIFELFKDEYHTLAPPMLPPLVEPPPKGTSFDIHEAIPLPTPVKAALLTVETRNHFLAVSPFSQQMVFGMVVGKDKDCPPFYVNANDDNCLVAAFVNKTCHSILSERLTNDYFFIGRAKSYANLWVFSTYKSNRKFQMICQKLNKTIILPYIGVGAFSFSEDCYGLIVKADHQVTHTLFPTLYGHKIADLSYWLQETPYVVNDIIVLEHRTTETFMHELACLIHFIAFVSGLVIVSICLLYHMQKGEDKKKEEEDEGEIGSSLSLWAEEEEKSMQYCDPYLLQESGSSVSNDYLPMVPPPLDTISSQSFTLQPGAKRGLILPSPIPPPLDNIPFQQSFTFQPIAKKGLFLPPSPLPLSPLYVNTFPRMSKLAPPLSTFSANLHRPLSAHHE